MVQQRSWKLYDDWKEVAHSRSSYRNQRRSNNKSSYGWKWKPWTACQFEGCRGWVYDHQKRSFCPQCIRPLPEPATANPPSVEPMCFPYGENFGNNIPEGDPLAALLAAADKIGWLGRDYLAAFLQSAQGKSKAQLRHLKTSWHRRNLCTTKPPRMRGSWRRSSRNRPRLLKNCGSNSRWNRTCLGGSARPARYAHCCAWCWCQR